MAISLGFGALFVTVIALLVVPSLYMILEDLKAWAGNAEPGGVPSEGPVAVGAD